MNAPFYRYALEATATSVTLQNTSIPAAMLSLQSHILSIFNSSSPQWPTIVRLYRSSIKYTSPPPSPLPHPRSQPPNNLEGQEPQSGQATEVGAGIASATCILLSLLFLWMVCKSCLTMRAHDGWIPCTAMPGVDPLTTLVVTGELQRSAPGVDKVTVLPNPTNESPR